HGAAHLFYRPADGGYFGPEINVRTLRVLPVVLYPFCRAGHESVFLWITVLFSQKGIRGARKVHPGCLFIIKLLTGEWHPCRRKRPFWHSGPDTRSCSHRASSAGALNYIYAGAK